jgi:hypothetical protein
MTPFAAHAAQPDTDIGTVMAGPGRQDARAFSPERGPADAFLQDSPVSLDAGCLQSSYPDQVEKITTDAEGTWVVLRTGQRILYASPGVQTVTAVDDHDVDVRTSMRQIYPLDPDRPDTPVGFEPGRLRSYALLRALYGGDPAQVRRGLTSVDFFGSSVSMARPAARALERVRGRLFPVVAKDVSLLEWLHPAGGQIWRKIAGESRLSPHSFGIAVDLAPDRSAYWRWAKVSPHPQQRSYPEVIVSAFEEEGFIWGGKWHEFDTMHFEYRPELICKARHLQGVGTTPEESPEAGGEGPRTKLSTSF